jgi:hypothetical protein
MQPLSVSNLLIIDGTLLSLKEHDFTGIFLGNFSLKVFGFV